MLDFHSHILPHIDDGSADVEESAALLTALRQQGVSRVCATPHFDASHRTPEAFLAKRAYAYETLVAHLTQAKPNGADWPDLRLGAEVAYYEGISRMSALADLRLQDTKLLLLEMPVGPWSRYMVKELSDLSCSGDITVVLAHVERYLRAQAKGTVNQLLEKGILLQSNASFFIERRTRRRALKMLADRQIHFLGSDTHDVKHRPPRLGEAYGVIRKKIGDTVLEEMDLLGHRLLNLRTDSHFS